MKLSSLFKQEDRQLIEKYCRERCATSYLGDHTALARVLGELLMYVDTRDLSLTPHMLMNGFWEMWVTQAVASHVKPGMRCIDVGANCGYYTLLLAELVGPEGFVEAFEPQKDLAELIQKSLTVNGFSRQGLVSAVAVDSQSGTASLQTIPGMAGSASLLELAEPSMRTSIVETTSLDDIGYGSGAAQPQIDFVKIDVQGLELRVLEGMQKTIKNSPKIAIAMEFTPTDHPDPRKALQRVKEMGLGLGTIGTDGMVRPLTLAEAVKPDTGGHRMLWLTRVPS